MDTGMPLGIDDFAKARKTMSMPDHFFFIRKKKEGADLFRGMAVEKAGAPI